MRNAHRLPSPTAALALLLLLCAVAASCGDDGEGGAGMLTPETVCANPRDCRLWEAGRIAGVRVGLAGGSQGKAVEIALAESNIAENHAFSWRTIWPAPDRWNFEPADRRYRFIEENGMQQAGFHFAWEQVFLDDLAPWVEEITDPEILREVLRERARTIFERYPGLDRINVINEPLPTVGVSPNLERNYFHRVLGPDYIVELFRIVDEFAPEHVALVLNENFTEYFPAKAEGLVRLVRSLVDAGAPIDSVGFQTHLMFTEMFHLEPDWELQQETMQRVADLGVDIWVSELDNPVDPNRPGRLEYQAENYRRAVESCLSIARCTDILVWGVQDTESYWFNIPYDDPAPLLFDRNFEPKPAYFAVRDALLAGRGAARQKLAPRR